MIEYGGRVGLRIVKKVGWYRMLGNQYGDPVGSYFPRDLFDTGRTRDSLVQPRCFQTRETSPLLEPERTRPHLGR